MKARHDLTTTRGQAAAADELLGVLKSIANPVLRDLEVRRVATLIGTSEAGLRARLGRIGSGEKTAGILKNPATELVRDRDLIDILLNRPDMATRIMDAFPPESYSDEDYGLIASLIYDEYDEKGIISTDSIYKSVDGERLRGKVLEVLRYGGEHGDEERDYEKLFAAWAGRKEEELLANEIKKKKDEHPGESLVEYFKLKKKISQKHKV